VRRRGAAVPAGEAWGCTSFMWGCVAAHSSVNVAGCAATRGGGVQQ
jgi:hypothetical protein